MAAGWPTLADVRTLLRLQPDPTEDAVIDSARLAAIEYGYRRTGNKWDVDSDFVPDSAYEAALLDSSRIYRRRDSIDGTIAWGDIGAIRVGRADPDVERLYSLTAPVVFG
jgi:hypothetical protein